MTADPETESAIQEHIQAFEERYARKDLEGVLELLAPELIAFGTGADERIEGIVELRAGIERDMVQAETAWNDWTWISVSRRGDVAWAGVEGVAHWSIDGQGYEKPVRFTGVYELREGRWLAVQRHISFPASDQPEGRSWPSPIEAIANAVSEERPDLRAQAAPDGTVTMLFTDIENSTVLTERLGDAQWLDVLRTHNAVVREQVQQHSCFEVKSQGDGFMIASQSARRALHCAIGIQRSLDEINGQSEEPIQVRMGLHTGEVLKDADDFFGKHVILASRIAGKARGGEILVSSILKELTESGGDIRFGPARDFELKGLTGSYRVHDVIWRDSRN